MVIEGVQNISVPIFDYSGLVVASLTTPYIQRPISTNDPDLDEAKTALAETGKKISIQLGVGVSTL
jgi:DNA-binding IclR family transcriptional regulator